MSEATIKFYTNNAQGAYLGDGVIDLPDYGIRITVRITKGADGKPHVSWPSSNGRFWATGIDRRATDEWANWILGQWIGGGWQGAEA
jgi:hypothetical protein